MQRLAGLALQNWRYIDGYAAAHNMPELADLPLGRFCSFVWYWATRNASDAREVERLERQVWMPPFDPSTGAALVAPTEGPWSAEAENASLGALKRSLGK